MGRKKKKKPITIKSEETTTVFGVLALLGSAVLVASMFIHNRYIEKIHLFLGTGAFLAAIILLLFALRMFGNKYALNKFKVIIGLSIFLISLLGFVQLVFFNTSSDTNALLAGGGTLGFSVASYATSVFGDFITVIGLFLIMVISLIIGFSIPLVKIFTVIKGITNAITKLIAEKLFPVASKAATKVHDSYVAKQSPASVDKPQKGAEKIEPVAMPKMMVGDLSGRNVIPVNETKISSEQFNQVPVEHTAIESDEQYSHWKYPSMDLLIKPKPYVVQDENVKKNSDIIEKTLESFGILAKVADVKTGPVVTQYALQITMGTKVAKINNLSKDLALALAAPSGMVRVEAPIPGTSLVGIEMPNMHPHVVTLRELLESVEMSAPMKLPIAVGRDVAGSIIVKDLQKMPHLLIAGATGSGKSITVNSFIMSLLFKHSPNELKFIMVDPKQVELSGYNGIPHLIAPVITDMEKVVSALKWAVAEMESRYKACKQVGVRNIEGYNSRNDVNAMPYIVIIIDEMADLMMLQGVEVESSIVRLAQMARAVGIHLVLATQRPSVNVITGLIKANIPARIGMSVTSVIDSRVILDTSGAETLLGKGDMLFKMPDSIRPVRVQGVMVSDDEIERVLAFIKEQSPVVTYSEEITQFSSGESQGVVAGGWEDSMFPDAVRVVVNAGRGSASILQSKLRIGYARAARLIEELESKGVVGPQDGSKPRDVLITDAEIFLGQYNKADNEDSR